jgi:hypothetical protein
MLMREPMLLKRVVLLLVGNERMCILDRVDPIAMRFYICELSHR